MQLYRSIHMVRTENCIVRKGFCLLASLKRQSSPFFVACWIYDSAMVANQLPLESLHIVSCKPFSVK
eukprot:c25774_g1_i1 orf=97-297(+)